jgi:hypothetical protein
VPPKKVTIIKKPKVKVLPPQGFSFTEVKVEVAKRRRDISVMQNATLAALKLNSSKYKKRDTSV